MPVLGLVRYLLQLFIPIIPENGLAKDAHCATTKSINRTNKMVSGQHLSGLKKPGISCVARSEHSPRSFRHVFVVMLKHDRGFLEWWSKHGIQGR